MPSTIRGSDNFDSAMQKGLGDGQSWQNVTASRATGTTYTNSTGRTIAVIINYYNVSQHAIYINGNYIYTNGDANGYNYTSMFLVPNGNTYGVFVASGSPALSKWEELR